MIDEHTELELKFSANDIPAEAFQAYMAEFPGMIPEKTRYVEGPDTYYENTTRNVARWRRGRPDGSGNHELTVKRRRSADSTQDRLEVDLKLNAIQTPWERVPAFMKALGFLAALDLEKRSWIYYADVDGVLVELVHYQVRRVYGPDTLGAWQRFLEVEVTKGSDVTPERAAEVLKLVGDRLRRMFGLDAPLNESLWEIFTGKTYLSEAK